MDKQEKYDLALNLVTAFTELYPESEFRFGHVVLSDYSLDDESIAFCIQQSNTPEWETRISDIDPATVLFLNLLRLLPESWREEPVETYP
jgi:hypothetical protein